MALFRKFFYRKPPDGLLEIAERVYVFDCCFSTGIMDDNEYKLYVGGIMNHLCDHYTDASIVVFNFLDGDHDSKIGNVLSEYDVTVMEYPAHYEGCPILTMEMIHYFLRSSENWLSVGQHNVLLMHSERTGWPVLAFMVAALLIYKKNFHNEHKTLDMIHKQAPRELLPLMSPLNPLPSQLRYLQYVSRRNVGSQWPPMDRALTLDCVILRSIPNLDAEGGCRPVLRVYGQDPFMASDRTPKVLFATPKWSKIVRHYKQADCELVKLDINCYVQGDVVMECISLDNAHERELIMFRVMFNTAFIRSNILMLNHDEIDTLWITKDQFPKKFRAEVIFSEMDSGNKLVKSYLPGFEDKDGLSMEAFATVQDIFSNVDWPDGKDDAALDVLQHFTPFKENLDNGYAARADIGDAWLESLLGNVTEEPKLKESENHAKSPVSSILEKQTVPVSPPSSDVKSITEKVELPDLIGLDFLSSIKTSSGTTPTEGKVTSEEPKAAPQSMSLTDLSQEANSIQKNVEFEEQKGAPQEQNVASQSMPCADLSPEQNSIQKKGEFEEQMVATQSMSHIDLSPDANSIQKKDEFQVQDVSHRRPGQSKIISQRVPWSSSSSPVSYGNSPRGSPAAVSRYHSAPSALGITALLHDHDASQGEEIVRPITNVAKPLQLSHISTIRSPSLQLLPSPPYPSLQSSTEVPVAAENVSAIHTLLPSSPQLTSGAKVSSFSQHSEPSLDRIQSPPNPPPSPLPPPPHSVQKSLPTPPPPPLPPFSGTSSSTMQNSCSVPPPPPPPLPLMQESIVMPVPSSPPLQSVSAPSPPPPPPGSSKNSAHIPPPPPLQSVSAPSPPPPPPGSSKNSAHIPPPPPPVLSRNAQCNGNVPPVPGPPGNVPPVPGPPKGRLLRSPGLRNPQTKKSNLKPYHWLKLTRAMQGSLWAEAQKPEEAAHAPQIDMSELERLFSVATPNSNLAKSNRASGLKSEKVQLIELRRAYNCEIMLSKVKSPLSELMTSVLALDDSGLDADQVDNLIKFCPTKEEMELLKGYNGDIEKLGKCEQFFLELMKVPRVEEKLRVFSFKQQFNLQVHDLRCNLNVVNSASEEIRGSVKLKRVMQTILSLGNALNYGTARGSAVGFKLDSLLKLTDTRARNNKMTLMHYLCKVISEKIPELLDFPNDLGNLEAATKIQLKILAEEMQAISKGLEKVVQELTTSENDGPISADFCKTLKEFLGGAECEVRSLTFLYSTVGRNADALAQYFGEDPARCSFEQVVTTLFNFKNMFVKAHEENCKQLEMEKKKAEKEAENEKLKTGAENLAQNLTIKSGNTDCQVP